MTLFTTRIWNTIESKGLKMGKTQKITKALIKQLNQKFIKFSAILNENKPVLGAERVDSELARCAKLLGDMYGRTLNNLYTEDISNLIESLECEIRLYERGSLPDLRHIAGEFVGLCVATKFYLKALK